MITCTFRACDFKTKNCLSRTPKVLQNMLRKSIFIYRHRSQWVKIHDHLCWYVVFAQKHSLYPQYGTRILGALIYSLACLNLISSLQEHGQHFCMEKCTVLKAVLKFYRELGRVSNFNQSINWHHHMKNHVEIDHLTKYDAFRAKIDQVMDLETWLKIHTNIST